MGRRPEERPRDAWPHRGRRSPWPAALLAVPLRPVAGQMVSVVPQFPLHTAASCSWFRGRPADGNNLLFTYSPATHQQANGAAFTGRESPGLGCSLHIREVTAEDSGTYVLHAQMLGAEVFGSTSVDVSALQRAHPPAPIQRPSSPPIPILLQPPHPVEGGSITLTLGNPLEKAYLCFWFRGLTTEDKNWILTYYFPPIKMQQENQAAFTGRETAGPGCSLRIRGLTSGDTGNYTVNVDTPDSSVIAQASVVVSTPVPSNGNAVLGIALGSLVAIALIVGTLLYFFLRARGQSNTGSTQTTAAPPAYENATPSEQVTTSSSAYPNHFYETLQHPTQSVYQQLKGSRQAGQASPLS